MHAQISAPEMDHHIDNVDAAPDGLSRGADRYIYPLYLYLNINSHPDAHPVYFYGYANAHVYVRATPNHYADAGTARL